MYLDKEKYIPYFLIILSILFAILGWGLSNGNSKTQYVRLIDVFIYGPYLTYLAFQEEYVFTIFEKINTMDVFVNISLAVLYATCGYLLYKMHKFSLEVGKFIVTISIVVQTLMKEIDRLNKELNSKTEN
jgi:predicted acyltransferase